MAAPTVTIDVADTALKFGETAVVTFTFSEAVTGFDSGDLTIGNGVLTTLSTTDDITWTANLAPTSATESAANVITLDLTGVTDSGAIPGVGTQNSDNYAIDTLRPTTTTIVVADPALKVGETSGVIITFSEAVTDLTTADLTVGNGALSGLATTDGGITWTATLTPTVATTSTTNLITLDNTGVTDVAGNAGTGTTDSGNYAVDTVRPTATTIVVADPALKVGETSLVTITFSESVTGLTTADLTTANGALSGLASGDGGVTWTATLTPSAATTDTTNLITLDSTGVADDAGNAGTGSIESNNYAIDTTRPTATIVVADTSLAAGETSLVTFTFSEAVNSLDGGDLTIDNGTLSAVSSADGGVTWTATLTPIAATTDTTNIIRLDNTGVADDAGNAGTGTTDSNNYAVDTVERPTATIVVADTALNVGETSGVTITFSEAVNGFTNADLTVANGTLSNLSTADNTTFTATLTPTAEITDTTNLITLDNTGVTGDVSGNPGAGTTASNNYAIDTTTAPPPPPPPPPPVEQPGTAGPDVVVGNDLSNVVAAGDGDDVVTGGIGNDTAQGDAGADFLQGNVGSDSITGGTGGDIVLGGQGDDFLQGNSEADYVSGDKGADAVLGGQGADIVYGGEGSDAVSGDNGDDIVRGGQGDDLVMGGDGADYVSGDRGSDIIIGGLGADTFHSFGDAGIDRVTDFRLSDGDRVLLDAGTTYTLAQVGADTVISMAGGGEMILAGVQLSSLTTGWIVVG